MPRKPAGRAVLHTPSEMKPFHKTFSSKQTHLIYSAKGHTSQDPITIRNCFTQTQNIILWVATFILPPLLHCILYFLPHPDYLMIKLLMEKSSEVFWVFNIGWFHHVCPSCRCNSLFRIILAVFLCKTYQPMLAPSLHQTTCRRVSGWSPPSRCACSDWLAVSERGGCRGLR